MLGLKLTTDPKWANIAEMNLEEILTDHAWCEQKAVSNAITIVVGWPEYPELVSQMIAIAKEELVHLGMVHDIIVKRGFVFGKGRTDDYVNELLEFLKKGMGREWGLIDRLLLAAMIEARSCERFRVLSTTIQDKELASFYHDLMVSEANHYTVFLGFAKKYAGTIDVDKRWEEWLEYEGKVILNYGKKERIHG